MSQDQAVAAPSRTSTFRNELNDAVGLEEAVLCYRNEYRVERVFNRLKSCLHIAPLFVKLNDQIEGPTYLLTLGVRVLTVTEFVLRRSLEQAQATLVLRIYYISPPRKGFSPSSTGLHELHSPGH